MAEFVQFRLEESLSVLYEMERVELFTKSEIRTIVKRKKEFEYKLERKTKRMEDYLSYIQYELHLYSLIKERRKKFGYHFKIKEIDNEIGRHILRLFKASVIRFPRDIKLWVSAFTFLKRMHWRIEASKLFQRMMRVHASKPEVWVAAAKFELEENENGDTARKLLLRGLRFNPNSKLLYREFFRMELMFAECLSNESTMSITELKAELKHGNKIKKGDVAAAVYRSAIENIPDAEFILSLLPICEQFDFTENIVNSIYDDLEKKFADSELAWTALAERQLKLKYEDSENKEEMSICNIAKYEAIFEDAVKKLPTEMMWTQYINSRLRLLEKKKNVDETRELLEKVLNLFSRASDANLLSWKLYICWAKILESIGKVSEARDTLEMGTTRYPDCVSMWNDRLSFMFRTYPDEIEDTFTIFKTAIKRVKDAESLPLWLTCIQWMIEKDPERVNDVFEMGLRMPPSVSADLKVAYLEWVALTDGHKKAKELYNSLWNSSPICIEFFQKMHDIEISKNNANIKFLRQILDQACTYFGRSNIDIWMKRIALENEHPQGDQIHVSNIHWKAVKALKPELVEKFIQQHTLASMDIGKMGFDSKVKDDIESASSKPKYATGHPVRGRCNFTQTNSRKRYNAWRRGKVIILGSKIQSRIRPSYAKSIVHHELKGQQIASQAQNK